MSAASAFEYAVVRVVPRVEREEFVNAGVVLCCLAQRFLAARVALDRARLLALAPWLAAAEMDAIERHLTLIALVCAGDASTGAVGAMAPARRFDWLVAPRSTVVQTSAVHAGLCHDAGAELERLFAFAVSLPAVEAAHCDPAFDGDPRH